VRVCQFRHLPAARDETNCYNRDSTTSWPPKTSRTIRSPEVKSLRAGRASLDGCFGRADGGELWLENFYIPPYSFSTNIEPLDPRRRRKLLLHAHEAAKIEGKLKTKGLSLIPLEVYFRRGWAKVALALAKGKTGADRRDDLKKKAIRREADKSFKGAYRG
jgi:SsrA-binding protein